MRTHSRKNNITFLDLVILRILADASRDNPPSQNDLYSGDDNSLVNDWLAKNNVPMPLITYPVSGRSQIQEAMKKLKDAGLITQGKRSFTVSGKGELLVAQLGKDWHNWYTRLPIIDQVIDFDLGEKVSRIINVV